MSAAHNTHVLSRVTSLARTVKALRRLLYILLDTKLRENDVIQSQDCLVSSCVRAFQSGVPGNQVFLLVRRQGSDVIQQLRVRHASSRCVR